MNRMLSATVLMLGAWCGFAQEPPKTDPKPTKTKVDDKLAKIAEPLKKSPPTGIARDEVDFVYLGLRPVHIRLHIRVQGKPLTKVWDEFITHIFNSVDTKRTGFLTKNEVARLPPPVLLFQNGFGGYGFGGEPGIATPPMEALDTNKDGKVSRIELDTFIRQAVGAPFQFKFGQKKDRSRYDMMMSIPGMKPPPTVDDLNKEVLRFLDTDKDGKLSLKELAAAPKILAKLDVDEDEMIARQEILPGAANMKLADSANQEPIPADPKVSNKELAFALLKRYGQNDVKLSRDHLGIDSVVFKRLDKDKDGFLDEKELADFAKREPDLEFMCKMAEKGSQDNEITLLKGEPRLKTLAARVRKAAEGTSILEMGTDLVHVRSGGAEKVEQLAFFVRQGFVAQFGAADKDNNGYLDEAEAKKSGMFGQLFPLLDKDGDGKVFLKELEEFLDAMVELQTRATAATVSLSYADEGRSLFDLLDANRDGRLSVRELRQIPKLLERFDLDKDGHLSLHEVPRNLQLTLKQGLGGGGGEFDFVLSLYTNAGSALPPAPKAGPLWFRKMDKNRDGDVSRKEFFGTDEEFRRIDTDGDGLISLEEAIRFDDAMRKRGKKSP